MIGQILPNFNTTMTTEIPAMLCFYTGVAPECVTADDLAVMDAKFGRHATELNSACVDILRLMGAKRVATVIAGRGTKTIDASALSACGQRPSWAATLLAEACMGRPVVAATLRTASQMPRVTDLTPALRGGGGALLSSVCGGVQR